MTLLQALALWLDWRRRDRLRRADALRERITHRREALGDRGVAAHRIDDALAPLELAAAELEEPEWTPPADRAAMPDELRLALAAYDAPGG